MWSVLHLIRWYFFVRCWYFFCFSISSLNIWRLRSVAVSCWLVFFVLFWYFIVLLLVSCSLISVASHLWPHRATPRSLSRCSTSCSRGKYAEPPGAWATIQCQVVHCAGCNWNPTKQIPQICGLSFHVHISENFFLLVILYCTSTYLTDDYIFSCFDKNTFKITLFTSWQSGSFKSCNRIWHFTHNRFLHKPLKAEIVVASQPCAES